MASFGKAFAAARKSGKKEFTWGGKSFHTRLAGETPSRAPTPSAAPRGSSGASRSTPTPTPRPSFAVGSKEREDIRTGRNKVEGPRGISQMKSPRAVGGPAGEAMYGGSPKLPQRKSMGGSALGGFIKWGDQAKKRPAYRNPSPRAR